MARKTSSEDLGNISWSEESLKLSDFVTQYPLPQIVQVANGYDGGLDENSLSSGQVLKIHKLTVERKLLCCDRNNKEVCIPVHSDQKIVLRSENYDTIFQRVADLARAKPLPAYVEVTRGYYNVDSNVNYELSVEPGEQLRVVEESVQKRKKFMLFENEDKVEIKIPFDCVAGFRPLVDNKKHLLSEVVPTEYNETTYPFYFEFDRGGVHDRLGVLKCTSVFDEKLIIASCGHEKFQVVFMIPQNLDVTVRLALGTLNNDPDYENIRTTYHNFSEIENKVQSSRKSKIYSKTSEISGFTVPPSSNTLGVPPYEIGAGWEKFEADSREKAKLIDFTSTEESKAQTPPTPVNTIIKPNRKISNITNDFVCIENQAANIEAENQLRRSSSVDPDLNGNIIQASASKIKIFKRNSSCDDAIEVRDMSVQELCASLRMLNMTKHVATFEENQIDGALFCELNKLELEEIGLNKFEVKKLHSFRDGWRPKLK